MSLRRARFSIDIIWRDTKLVFPRAEMCRRTRGDPWRERWSYQKKGIILLGWNRDHLSTRLLDTKKGLGEAVWWKISFVISSRIYRNFKSEGIATLFQSPRPNDGLPGTPRLVLGMPKECYLMYDRTGRPDRRGWPCACAQWPWVNFPFANGTIAGRWISVSASIKGFGLMGGVDMLSLSDPLLDREVGMELWDVSWMYGGGCQHLYFERR